MMANMDETYREALDLAAKQLSYRALSAQGLFDKLVEKGQPPEHASYAVAWMLERNLLNDEQYALSLLHGYCRRGYGPMRIRQELKRKKLEREVIDLVMQQYELDLEIPVALLDKRLRGDCSERKEVDKAVAALARRGFTWDEIRLALAEYKERLAD